MRILNLHKYKRDLVEAVRASLVGYVVATKEKEVVHVQQGDYGDILTVWIEGRFKITIEDLYEKKKEIA